jgi:hypothetical protein
MYRGMELSSQKSDLFREAWGAGGGTCVKKTGDKTGIANQQWDHVNLLLLKINPGSGENTLYRRRPARKRRYPAG